MVNVLFNIYNERIEYTEIHGVLKDYSKLSRCAEYVINENRLQKKNKWATNFDAGTIVFVINLGTDCKPIGLYDSIKKDGYF